LWDGNILRSVRGLTGDIPRDIPYFNPDGVRGFTGDIPRDIPRDIPVTTIALVKLILRFVKNVRIKMASYPKNKRITEALQILLEKEKRSTEKTAVYKISAYRKTIQIISGLDHELKSGKEAQEFKGIGKKIGAKIDEIIETGRLQAAEEAKIEEAETADFCKVWGVGPKTAKNLREEGIKTIDQLRKKQYLLTDAQKIGLKYYDDFQKRASRAKVLPIVNSIKKAIIEFERINNVSLLIRVCGSFRRKAETCGDLDILLSMKKGEIKLEEIVKYLCEIGILKETLGLGNTKYMGVVNLNTGMAFRIDIEFIKRSEWSFALLYFTGSGPFNEKQRQIAKKKGLRLSEHGFFNISKKEYISGIKTEKDIFDYLGMDYLEPHER